MLAGLLTVATTGAVVLVALSGSLAADPAAALVEGQRATEALRGSPSEVIAEHVRTVPWILGTLVVQGPLAFTSFLLGLAAGKIRALGDLQRHQRVLRLLQWVGLPVGLSGSLVFASFGGTHDTFATAVGYATAPLLTAAYAATMLRVFSSPRAAVFTEFLAAAGRLALSNYLLQSVICALVFTGLGAGLIGQVSPGVVLSMTFAVFVVQIIGSYLWCQRFRYGPVEWLLRAVTYASWNPRSAGRQQVTA